MQPVVLAVMATGSFVLGCAVDLSGEAPRSVSERSSKALPAPAAPVPEKLEVAVVPEPAAAAPDATDGMPKIKGKVPRDCHQPEKGFIQRVVRGHHNKIKYCYQKGLMKNPDLAGLVKVNFTVQAHTGEVDRARIVSSDVGDKEVDICIVEAVERWLFPPPCDDMVVTYPFKLSAAAL
jgi:hypothetical protein